MSLKTLKEDNWNLKSPEEILDEIYGGIALLAFKSLKEDINEESSGEEIKTGENEIEPRIGALTIPMREWGIETKLGQLYVQKALELGYLEPLKYDSTRVRMTEQGVRVLYELNGPIGMPSYGELTQ